MEELMPELKSFLAFFFEKYKYRRIKLDSLNLEMNIEKDLDVFDLDADMLISEFIERFEIDHSEFDWRKYGYPTGLTFVRLLRMLFGRKKWIERIADRQVHTTFKLKNLQEAILTCKLV